MRAVRVRRIGGGARRVVTAIAVAFGGIGALRLASGEPGAGIADLFMIVGSVGLWLWSLRVGIWVRDNELVVRSFWRTLRVPTSGDYQFTTVPYTSVWSSHDDPFLSMLVLEDGGRRRTLQFTVAWRAACLQDAWFLDRWPRDPARTEGPRHRRAAPDLE